MNPKEIDITLVNMNLMYAVIDGVVDYQAYIPVGVLSLAASLQLHGFTTKIRDYQLHIQKLDVRPFLLDDIGKFLAGSSRIIGFSCMSNLLPFTLLAAKRIKEIRPETIIILGGVGPTGAPIQIMKEFQWVDFVCSGEGEHALVDLMKSLVNNTISQSSFRIPGILSREPDGEIVFTPPLRIENIDELPLPAYHLLDIEKYDAAFSILTSRGCPYKCTFCTETNHWGNKVVFRSIDNVIEDLRLIKKYSNSRVVLFQDDQITLDKKRAINLFKRIHDEYPEMKWKAFVRVNLIDEELLKIMSECGFIQVRFGIESGSNKVLREIKKGFTIEEAAEKIELSLKYIPSVHASFIWGFPSETYDDFLHTVFWLKKFQLMGCTSLPFLLSPLPNSEIFRTYQGPLDFVERLQANFNNSGAETLDMKGSKIRKENRYMFEFIKKYPHIFPGFFLYDYKNNIKKKMKHVYKDHTLVFRGYKKYVVGDYHKTDL